MTVFVGDQIYAAYIIQEQAYICGTFYCVDLYNWEGVSRITLCQCTALQLWGENQNPPPVGETVQQVSSTTRKGFSKRLCTPLQPGGLPSVSLSPSKVIDVGYDGHV